MLRQVIIDIDQTILDGRLRHWRAHYAAFSAQKAVGSSLPFRMEVFYAKNPASSLASLCDLYGSDKGELKQTDHPYPWPSHSYTDFYELLFAARRFNIERVIECGVGTNNPHVESSMGINGRPGASLRVWRDYFPNARIIGIDIDKDILFAEDRIDTYHCDQTSAGSIHEFRSRAGLRPGSVDIMIDDGLHAFHAGRCLFENMNDLLREGGIYVIEDVSLHDKIAYAQYLGRLTNDFAVKIVDLHRPGLPLWDNALVVITKF